MLIFVNSLELKPFQENIEESFLNNLGARICGVSERLEGSDG
jgi:hypothetical protein